MDNAITFTTLNDFIFCPASIYFHNSYGSQATETYQNEKQILGKAVHNAVDESKYSSSKNILQGIACYTERYNLIGKIDTFDCSTGTLTERKRTIKTIYDGYVFQLYAQYFAMLEMGYNVKHLRFYSYTDNKIYNIALPQDNPEMLQKFEITIAAIKNFQLSGFKQENTAKCQNCIYEPACDRSLL